MLTDKLINEFLISLYKHHIEIYGESISTLKEGGLFLLDSPFPEGHPEAIIQLDESTIKDLTYNLGKELEARGFAVVDNLFITLTPDGYKEAKRLVHPYRSFIKLHWAWSLGILLTIINTVVTVVRLLLCP